MPEVAEGGGKTNGKFIQRIGRYTAEAGPDGTVVSLVENDTLRHSLNAAFCAPDQFTLTILNERRPSGGRSLRPVRMLHARERAADAKDLRL